MNTYWFALFQQFIKIDFFHFIDKLKTFWWILSILLFIVLLWNIKTSKKTRMLWNESIHENASFLVLLFTWKSKLSLPSGFTPNNFLLIQNLRIRNMYIYWHFRANIFRGNILSLHLLPSDLLKINETFFLMLLVDCLARILYLKSICKDCCFISFSFLLNHGFVC